MSEKILLALQFWNGDRAAALDLARLVADLEHTHSELADFLFMCRFDCEQDPDTVKYVSRKFNTFAVTSKRRGVGWPMGCNDLFHSVIEWAYHLIKAKKLPKYRAILTFEADTCPLRRDWVNLLGDRFDALLKQNPKLAIAGDLTPNPLPHVNGNCFINGDTRNLFWFQQILSRTPPGAGWDYYFRLTFEKRGWAALPGIWSEYGVPTFPENRWEHVTGPQGVVLHHGTKDGSLRALVRQKLLGEGLTKFQSLPEPISELEQQKQQAIAFLLRHAPELLK